MVRVLGKGQKQLVLKVSQDLIERVRQTYHGREHLFETSGGKPLGRESVSREITRAGWRNLGKQIWAYSLRHCGDQGGLVGEEAGGAAWAQLYGDNT